MNKRLLYIFTFVASIICILLFFVSRFLTTSLIASDGYYVSDSKIDKELMSSSKTVNKNNFKLVKMTKEDSIISNLGRYYVASENMENVEINTNFPLFTNDGMAIINYNSNNKLINSKFEVFDSYENLTLTGGRLFNYGDPEQADGETYYFLSLANGSYVNLFEIELSTYDGKVKIPVNSVINFQKDYIKFYYNKGNKKLVFSSIDSIIDSNITKMDKSKYTYKMFFSLLSNSSSDDSNNKKNNTNKNNSIAEENNIGNNDDDDGYSSTGTDDSSINVDNNETSEREYVKPVVSAEDFIAKVYSASGVLNVRDPSGAIYGGVSFKFYDNGKLYSRKSFVASGNINVNGLKPNTEYDIVGSYRYFTSGKKTKEVEFFYQTITTGDYLSLDPIKISFRNGMIYPNKISVENIRISSDLDSEAMMGLSKINISIGNEKYSLGSGIIRNLLAGKTVTYDSPTSLKSDTVYDYEFSIQDAFGNPLKLNSDKGRTHTSKAIPSVTITPIENRVGLTKFNIVLKNVDGINIANYRYIITDISGNVILNGDLDSSKDSQTLERSDFDPNSLLFLKVYGTFDIDDGNGTLEDYLLGESKFSTMPLSSLGYVRIITLVEELSNSSANVKYHVDLGNVSPILLLLLDEFKVEIEDDSGEVVYTNKFNKGNIQSFIKGEEQLIDLTDCLQSFTNYNIKYSGIISQGRVKENVVVISDVKKFTTYKNNAYISLKNEFFNRNMIDFDVCCVDEDAAITGRVIMEMRNSNGVLVGMEEIPINGDYIRLSYDKLDPESLYTFTFIAEGYNVGLTNITFVGNKVLYIREFTTVDKINGKIELQGINRIVEGNNLFDLSYYSRIRVEGSGYGYKQYDLENNSVSFGAKNGYVNFSYYLPEAVGSTVTVSFKARYSNKTVYRALAYVNNTYGESRKNQITNIPEPTDSWNEYMYTFELVNPYVGFMIDAPPSVNERTDIIFKDINIFSDNITEKANNDVSFSVYSEKYKFYNTKMLSGEELMPYASSSFSDYTVIGNEDNGKARISYKDKDTKEILEYYVYKGRTEVFTVPKNGEYIFEAWGAQGGGDGVYAGGKGAYTYGEITLKKGDKIYVNVGGRGGSEAIAANSGGYNGGGYASSNKTGFSYGGGGATDFRVVDGAWNDTESLKSRIMVAAGGGGATQMHELPGGAGGALVGLPGNGTNESYKCFGGTQVAAGVAHKPAWAGGFGYAPQVEPPKNEARGGGGGGGWFGGASGWGKTGAGGSSYISGHQGCVALKYNGSVFATYDEYIAQDELDAKFIIRLSDAYGELSSNNFYISLYMNGVPVENSPFIYDIEDRSVTDRVISFLLKRDKEYKIVLSIKYNDRFYDLDSYEFDTRDEVRTISSLDDFLNIMPSGHYVVTNDIDVDLIKNTLIEDFYGTIDFQGHYLEIYWTKTKSHVFATLNGGSVIKNIVIKAHMDTPTSKAWAAMFAYTNYGTIDNMILEVVESLDSGHYCASTLIYINYGTISNFIVHNKVTVYAMDRFGILVNYNYGFIQNGYMYGAPFDLTKATINNTKLSGVIAYVSGANSRIENVFSLIPVNAKNLPIEREVGNLVGSVSGKMYNCFSAEFDEYFNGDLDKDPNFRSFSGNGKNIYYFSKNKYKASTSRKGSFLSLYDANFMDILLNGYNAFDVVNNINLGYYPKLRLNHCMPNQEWLPLPKITGDDYIDITSIDVEENKGDSAIIKFTMNNPALEKVSNVIIDSINNVEVLSQDDLSIGQSSVRIRISDPSEYKSKYYMAKLVVKNDFGREREVSFPDGPKEISVSFFHLIKNLNDWKLMRNNLRDNYMLANDLDFSGVSPNDFCFDSKFYGTLDGNGHTITNMLLPGSKKYVFSSLDTGAKISNLTIDNIKFYGNSSGFIGSARSVILDNVHMKNVDISSSLNTVGALVVDGTGVEITNSSVTKAKIQITSHVDGIYVGAFSANLRSSSVIYNSFVQDVDIIVSDAVLTEGVGAIVGSISDGTIKNCYATGSIICNSRYVGGISGKASGVFSNIWTYVDISTEQDYVGGFTGYLSDDSSLSSLIVLGPIISTYPGEYINRSVGNSSLSYENNYFWQGQLFHGVISEYFVRELPLADEQICNINTYYDLVKFNDDFDYNRIEDGIMPKLKSTSGGDILPNQKDFKIDFVSDLSIVGNVMYTYSTATTMEITFRIKNINNYDIKNVRFDYLTYDDDKLKVRKNEAAGLTTINITGVRAELALDFYLLTGISYIKDNKLVDKYFKVKIDIQFFKEISNFNDWNNIAKSQTNDDVYENYRLTGDIDFKNVTPLSLKVGRLNGQNFTIKNINVSNISTPKYNIIDIVNISLYNVNFCDITLSAKENFEVDYFNLIGTVYGSLENIEFSNLIFNGERSSFVSPVGTLKGISINKINCKDSEFYGGNYVSGVFSMSDSYTDVTNINVYNIKCDGWNYVGGVLCYMSQESAQRWFQITGEKVNVTGNSRVGGLFGEGGASKSEIKDSNVFGRDGGSYIGGYAGKINNNVSSSVKVIDVRIEANGDYVGGICGETWSFQGFYVDGLTITNRSITGRTGGLAGVQNGFGNNYNHVNNATIIAENSIGGTGGLFGEAGSTLTFSYFGVNNVKVVGKENVGGVMGVMNRGTFRWGSVNAQVIGEKYVGGLVGTITEPSFNQCSFYQVALESSEVTARDNYAGLIAGKSPYALTDTNFYELVLVGNVECDKENYGPDIPVTSSYSYIPRVYFYSDNRYNGEKAERIVKFNYLSTNSGSVSLAELKTKSWWADKIKGGLAYSALKNGTYTLLVENGRYPIGSGSGLSFEDAILLPNEGDLSYFRVSNDLILHELPTFDIYSSGIDSFNIEFSDVDSSTQLIIKEGRKEVYNEYIEQRVYTFEYNYNSLISIVLTDGYNRKVYDYSVSDLANKVSTFDKSYAYIYGKKLMGNIKTNDDNFIHLYDKYALNENYDVYDMSKGSYISRGNDFSITPKTNVRSLFSFDLGINTIDTFYKYSVIHKDNGDVVYENQLFYKNGSVDVVDKYFDNNKYSVIVDKSGSKNYVSVLGNDGVIYNFKDDINFPSKFTNSGIAYMSNNINNKNSSYVVVMYKTGRVVVFDYLTGKNVSEEKAIENVSFFDYITEEIKFRKQLDSKTIKSSYNSSLELIDMLQDKPIGSDSSGRYFTTTRKKNNSGTKYSFDSDYVTYYNSIRGKHDVIDLGSLILGDEKEVVSETDKILTSNELVNTYMKESILTKAIKNINIVILLGIVLFSVIVSLILVFINDENVIVKEK